MSTRPIWVDLQSGTYGDASSIVFLDIPEHLLEAWANGQASDSTIIRYARQHGRGIS